MLNVPLVPGLLLALAIGSAGAAQPAAPRTAEALPADHGTRPPVRLAELAEQADAVVLAQVRDTDYVYRREFPVRGSAFLRVLIAYQLTPAADLVEVYEEGLHPGECYFPNPTVFEEGRRYLLFLRRDPDQPGRFRGLPQGCALDVLVDADNRYALRIPVTGIALADELEPLASPRIFTDFYARETSESLESVRRDAWLEAGWLRATDEGYVYTLGVDLGEIRRLMWPEGVPAQATSR